MNRYIFLLSLFLFCIQNIYAFRIDGPGVPGNSTIAYAGETYTYTITPSTPNMDTKATWYITDGRPENGSPTAPVGQVVRIKWYVDAKNPSIEVKGRFSADNKDVLIYTPIGLRKKDDGGGDPGNGGGEIPNPPPPAPNLDEVYIETNKKVALIGEYIQLNINYEGRQKYYLNVFNWTGEDMIATSKNGLSNIKIYYNTPGIKKVACKTHHAHLKQPFHPTIELAILPKEIVGPNSICRSANYKVENIPTGYKVDKWEVSDGLKITSGQGSSQITVESTKYKHTAYIYAYINGFKLTKEVATGYPHVDKFLSIKLSHSSTSPVVIYTGNQRYNELEAVWEGPEEILSYEWIVSSSKWQVIERSGSSSWPYPTPPPKGQYVYFKPLQSTANPGERASVILKATNRCGTGQVLISIPVIEGHP